MAFRQREMRMITLDDLMRDPDLGGGGDRYSEVDQDNDHSECGHTDGWRHELVYATTTIGITKRDGGTCKVEESVYGAALVMPQLARTVGWNTTFTILAIRSALFLALNLYVQAYLLKMVAKEQLVMDNFAGQMHLCDFGLEACPGAGCRGPAGTDITPSRLYGWSDIMNRNFVKDSLKALFPDRVEEIDAKVDPGEYGMESNMCRYLCCFIFMIDCLDELEKIWGMMRLIYYVPNKAEPWIHPRCYEAGDTTSKTGKIEDVRLTIAGMPVVWKFLSVTLILVPKAMLWKLTVETGIIFLMETASITDLIINSVALDLILGFDELIMASLMHEEEHQFVSAVEEFAFYDEHTSCVGDMSLLTVDEIIDQYKQKQFGFRSWDREALSLLFPYKLVLSICGTWFFVWQYYLRFCAPDEEPGAHRWVSETMYLPLSSAFDWGNAFLPRFFPMKFQDEPYWDMPGISS